jgi:hypothetical protein
MNRTLAVIVVACFAADAHGAEPTGAGPIQSSVERAAARLVSTLAEADRTRQASPAASTPGSQSAPAGWGAVEGLASGRRVVVTTTSERGIKGQISTVDENVLRMIDRQGRDRAINRNDVLEVRLDHELTAAKSTALGLLLGVLTGSAAGSRVEICQSCDPPIPPTFAYGVFGGMVGTGVGYAVGSAISSRPGRLVYASPRP